MRTSIMGHPRVRGRKRFFNSSASIESLADSVEGRDDVNIILVGKRRMSFLNRRYKGRTGPAEILTFPFEQDGLPDEIETVPAGEIYLCWDPLEKKAESLGVEPESYLLRLVIHGILHLKGYTHENATAAAEMESREKSFLRPLVGREDLLKLFG